MHLLLTDLLRHVCKLDCLLVVNEYRATHSSAGGLIRSGLGKEQQCVQGTFSALLLCNRASSSVTSRCNFAKRCESSALLMVGMTASGVLRALPSLPTDACACRVSKVDVR